MTALLRNREFQSACFRTNEQKSRGMCLKIGRDSIPIFT